MSEQGQEQLQVQTQVLAAILLKDIKKEYFGGSQIRLQQGGEMFQRIAEASNTGDGFGVTLNFDPNVELPPGYGIAVQPLSKNAPEGSADGRVRTGVIIAAVPDVELFAAHEKGNTFLRDTIAEYCIRRVVNAARPKDDGSQAEMPFQIEAFLETRRGRESFKAFTEVAPAYVKALRKKGLRFITASILRQALQFQSFAEETFPKIQQVKWEGIINMIAAKAESLGHDASVIRKWIETRSQATQTTFEDFELEDLELGDPVDEAVTDPVDEIDGAPQVVDV